ncbi:MAG: ATP-binding protein, partial [Simplicispira sp.]|nr:ATP-binding protein [Simplicispira sp.]
MLPTPFATSAHTLAPAQLRLNIDPATLGFAHTGELQSQPLPWIGQERAEAAARFGLGMQQPDYHLFVLGDIGSGRTSLLTQAMHEAAALRPVPPDLCYLHNFDQPERTHALRLPAGQGRVLHSGMEKILQALQTDIPKRLEDADFRADSVHLDKTHQAAETQAFATLEAFARERHFALSRDSGNMVFTLLGAHGQPLTEAQAKALTPEQRATISQAEEAMRAEIANFLATMRPLERARDQARTTLRRTAITPLLAQALDGLQSALRTALQGQANDSAKMDRWFGQVQKNVLDQLALFLPLEGEDDNEAAEDERKDRLEVLLAQCRANLAVDNSGRTAAPVIVEDNPQLRSLFGSIEAAPGDDGAPADFLALRAGSLLQAHGGFLMLHLRDVAAGEGLWERLRRFLRCTRIQIDESSAAHGHPSRAALQPEPVEVDVKIVLIGSVDEYYALQAADPEVALRFRAKVDFAESFRATAQTRRATAVLIARIAAQRGLPDFSAAAVARLLEQSHREADDQTRQSALFAQTEALAIESAALCRARTSAQVYAQVEAIDIETALQARTLRHNYTEQRLHESIADGERLMTLHGTHVAQVNALTQIDQGDYRFGFPVRITARAFAGHEGLLNIEREVEMSGPIHDKGVLILHSYLTALFGHIAPLALNASVVFEQEYSGVEGDSASCAELYALLSALSGLPLAQGIAVTGALNQHGQVLPVGGINEKIEGWFNVCEAGGLDGTQGALIPARNLPQLMLERRVIDAVAAGHFHIYTAAHVSDGLALLTGQAPGMAAGIATIEPDSVLGRAEQTLRAFRRACQAAGQLRLHTPG